MTHREWRDKVGWLNERLAEMYGFVEYSDVLNVLIVYLSKTGATIYTKDSQYLSVPALERTHTPPACASTCVQCEAIGQLDEACAYMQQDSWVDNRVRGHALR